MTQHGVLTRLDALWGQGLDLQVIFLMASEMLFFCQFFGTMDTINII